jgi:uncharacterized tellurite resistance protein B-like protein
MTNKEQGLACFRNIYKIAVADGYLVREEKEMLLETGQRMGVSRTQARDIMHKINHLDFIIPDDSNEQIQHLEYIIRMMMVDHEIHDREYELCYAFAKKIGRNEVILQRMIDKVSKEMSVLY